MYANGEETGGRTIQARAPIRFSLSRKRANTRALVYLTLYRTIRSFEEKRARARANPLEANGEKRHREKSLTGV